nr:RDD family protein [Aeoliella straminimaris]
MLIATQGKRLLNMIIDGLVIQVLSFGMGMVIGIGAVAANGGAAPQDSTGLQVFSFVSGILLSLAYYVFTEGMFQRTVAKLVTGTIVVAKDGTRPSFGQILGRSLARFVPFEAFSFLGGKHPVGWHDSWSGTRVIAVR